MELIPIELTFAILEHMPPFYRYQIMLLSSEFKMMLGDFNRNLHPTIGDLNKIDNSKEHTKYAVKYSDIEVIKRLTLREYASYVAAKLGKYDIFVNMVPDLYWWHSLLDMRCAADRGGEPRIIKYLLDNYGISYDIIKPLSPFIIKCKRGNIGEVIELCEGQLYYTRLEGLRVAKMRGYKDIIEYLEEWWDA